MSKLIFSLLTILVFQTAMAQDIKKVRNAYDKKDWAKAKEAVDLYTGSEKGANDWEGWYYKGLIYAQVAKDPTLKSATPDAWDQSFSAYKKASQLDAKQVTTFMTVRNYPIFENYQELSKAGTELFNANDYIGAFTKYREADVVGRYIFENGWALTEIDTVLSYYIGAAAMQADMTEEAVVYYQKIADREISGDGYDLCYRFLAYHFDKKGDRATADKYVASGRKLYPKDSYYDKLDLDRQRKIGGGPDLFVIYEKVIAAEPSDYDMRFDYAAEMFNWIYTDQKGTSAEKEKISAKIIEQLNACVALKADNPDAPLLIGKTYFNEAAALQESYNSIKGKTPADLDKKAGIKTKMEKNLKDAIKSLETAASLFEKMPADDFKKDRRLKSEYKTTLYLLSESYKFLGDNAKAQFYEKKEQAL